MDHNLHDSQPIVVGGLGGSGTRVIAEILSKIGIFIGTDMNSASDNLWFAFLFKRPKWFLKHANSNRPEILQMIEIFEKIMLGNQKISTNEWRKLFKATIEWSLFGNHFWGIGSSGRGLWSFIRFQKILSAKHLNVQNYKGWGWKEPNSHVYLEFLAEYFKNMKYIHLIRHGLDMAYSKNQSQLYSWGEVYNINTKDQGKPLPELSVEYWIAANKKALETGNKLLGNNFLAINFEKLCKDPAREISILLEFLNIDKKVVQLDELTSMPVMPKTAGRYRKHDLSVFDSKMIDEVIQLGFEVDRIKADD